MLSICSTSSTSPSTVRPKILAGLLCALNNLTRTLASMPPYNNPGIIIPRVSASSLRGSKTTARPGTTPFSILAGTSTSCPAGTTTVRTNCTLSRNSLPCLLNIGTYLPRRNIFPRADCIIPSFSIKKSFPKMH